MEAGVDQHVLDALTDLNAVALWLDVERHRLDDRVLELAGVESSVAERRALIHERDEIAGELEAFRRTVTAFQEQMSQLTPSDR